MRDTSLPVQAFTARSGTWEVDTESIEADATGHSEARVIELLKELLDRPAYHPPLLPRIADRVVAASRRADLSAANLAELAAQEPQIAAALLKTASSAAFGAQSRVRTLQDAVVRLGVAGVRQVILELAFDLRVFRALEFAPRLDQLRRHGRLVAGLARLVCRHAPLDGEHAFLCGLLHDAGMSALLVAEAELARRGVHLPGSTLDRRLLAARPRANAIVALRWSVPSEVRLVLELLHDPSPRGRLHPIVAVLIISDELAAANGTPALPTNAKGEAADRPTSEQLTAARAALSFDDRVMATLRTEAAAQALRERALP